MLTERHLSSFTDELSTRREWLIGHQPSITETISMKPDSRRRDALGNLPPELMSDDSSMSAPVAQPKPDANPPQKKPARKRQKKRKRTGNQLPVSDKTVTPRVSVTAANSQARRQLMGAHRGPTYPRVTLPADRWQPGTDTETHVGHEAPAAVREAPAMPHEAPAMPDTVPIHNRSSHSDRRDDGKDCRDRADQRPSSGNRRGNDDRRPF